MPRSASASKARLLVVEDEAAHAALYLACAAKSNAAYQAYNQARALIKQDKSRGVPNHLRNAPTKLMKDLNFGHAYRYAHDYPEAYVAGEQYFPDDMSAINFYQPTARGLEKKIQEKLAHLRALDEQTKN